MEGVVGTSENTWNKLFERHSFRNYNIFWEKIKLSYNKTNNKNHTVRTVKKRTLSEQLKKQLIKTTLSEQLKKTTLSEQLKKPTERSQKESKLTSPKNNYMTAYFSGLSKALQLELAG